MKAKDRGQAKPKSQQLRIRHEELIGFFREQFAEWQRRVAQGSLDPSRYVQQWLTRSWRNIYVCSRCIAFDGVTAEIGDEFVSRRGESALHPPICEECHCGVRTVVRGEVVAQRIPPNLWEPSEIEPIPSGRKIEEAKEHDDWDRARSLLMQRLAAEETHAQNVRKNFDREPVANPDTYFAAAVAMRKRKDFEGEIEVVNRFLARPSGRRTKKIERLIARADRAFELLDRQTNP